MVWYYLWIWLGQVSTKCEYYSVFSFDALALEKLFDTLAGCALPGGDSHAVLYFPFARLQYPALIRYLLAVPTLFPYKLAVTSKICLYKWTRVRLT
jgi:hypothetical protein